MTTSNVQVVDARLYYFSFVAEGTFLGGAFALGATCGAALLALERSGALAAVDACPGPVETLCVGPADPEVAAVLLAVEPPVVGRLLTRAELLAVDALVFSDDAPLETAS